MRPELLALADDSRTAYDGTGPRPVRTHVWRPEPSTSDTPLVVLSHGTGGAAQDLVWLAEALCGNGFTVAAVDHHGNTYAGPYHPESFVWWWERARDLSYAVTALGATGPVGAAGFSIGGYAVAAALGARLDPMLYGALVTGRIPAPPTPEYPDLAADLRARYTPDEIAGWVPAAGASYADPRITAGFLMSPSMGPLVTDASLAAITAATAVRWGGADRVAPAPENAMRYAAGIPGADGAEVGADTGHLWFVTRRHDDGAAQDACAADAVAFFKGALGG